MEVIFLAILVVLFFVYMFFELAVMEQSDMKKWIIPKVIIGIMKMSKEEKGE